MRTVRFKSNQKTCIKVIETKQDSKTVWLQGTGRVMNICSFEERENKKN